MNLLNEDLIKIEKEGLMTKEMKYITLNTITNENIWFHSHHTNENRVQLLRNKIVKRRKT